jgi:protein TonB
VSENRFLQSFSALLASAILVCGAQLLLIASQEYGRPELEPAPKVTAAPSVAQSPARESIEVEITGTTEVRSHPGADHFAGDQASLSPPPNEVAPASEVDSETPSRPEQAAESGASSSATAALGEIEETTPSQEVAVAVPFQNVEQPAPAEPTPEAAPSLESTEAAPSQETPAAVPSPDVAEAAPTQQAEDVTPAQDVEKESIATAPQLAAPEVAPSEPLQPAEPATTATAEDTVPTAPQVAEAEEVSPATPSPFPNAPEASSAPKLAAADATPQKIETAKAEPAIVNVPLPTRKPKVVAARPIAPPAEPEVKQAAVEPKPRWTPMTLAPADKDTVAKPKLEPKRSESMSGYNAKVWSALAHHKPRAGKAGSAIVTFAIGPAGGLRSARISGSSGDTRLDQMALQTVRSAAPFPPPPNPATASYTIRIYFR